MGNCNMCGECCRWVIIENIPPTPFLTGYYKARGWTYDRKQRSLWIPTVCVHLGDDNRCRIYENRPQFCKDFVRWKRQQPGITDKCECMKEMTKE